jgi:V/A-type H+-transporting ATPase subunit F
VKKIVFLTPDDARGGFGLAGVRQLVTTSGELSNAVATVVRDVEVGVLVVDERLLDAAARERLRDSERRWSGLVVVLPAPGRAAVAEEDYARQLIRSAIGYQVRVSL